MYQLSNAELVSIYGGTTWITSNPGQSIIHAARLIVNLINKLFK